MSIDAGALPPEPWPGRGWPLPALLVWLAAWAVFKLGVLIGLAVPWAGLLGMVFSLCAMALSRRPWRRALIALGFPISWGVWLLRAPASSPESAASAPGLGWAVGWLVRGDALVWLLPVLVLLLIYPVRAWADAPLFPTPKGALEGLPQALKLQAAESAPPRVLDAGCGLGAGLREWRRVLPNGRLAGWEWSPLLRLWTAWRLPWATVQRRDIWASPWSNFEVVYLFQRPESMPRAWEKACAEMRPGAWLVSLEFQVPGRVPDASLEVVPGKPVWAYQIKPERTPAKKAGQASPNV